MWKLVGIARRADLSEGAVARGGTAVEEVSREYGMGGYLASHISYTSTIPEHRSWMERRDVLAHPK